MARGWESKSVESQMEEADGRRAGRESISVSPAEAARRRERASIELSRTRVLHDLETARKGHHRDSLEAALRFLDDKIEALQK